jgi:hypothetical protein
MKRNILFLLVFVFMLFCFVIPGTSFASMPYKGVYEGRIDCGGGNALQPGMCSEYTCLWRPCVQYIATGVPFLDMTGATTTKNFDAMFQPKPVSVPFADLEKQGYDLKKCKFKIGRYSSTGFGLQYYENAAQVYNNNPTGNINPSVYGVGLNPGIKAALEIYRDDINDQMKNSCAIISLNDSDNSKFLFERAKSTSSLCNYPNIEVLCPPLDSQSSYPTISPELTAPPIAANDANHYYNPPSQIFNQAVLNELSNMFQQGYTYVNTTMENSNGDKIPIKVVSAGTKYNVPYIDIQIPGSNKLDTCQVFNSSSYGGMSIYIPGFGEVNHIYIEEGVLTK